MHKRMSRILACFVAVALALGSVCYRPPKAEAAVLPSAVAVAAVVAVMCATGFELNQEGTATGAIADALEREVRNKMKEHAEAKEMYQEQFEEAIASRVELLEDGKMRLAAGAVELIDGFADWWIDKLGLSAGGGSVDVFDYSGVETDIGFFTPSSFKIPVESSVLGTGIPIGQTVTFASGCKVMFDGSRAYVTYADGTVHDWLMTESDPTSLYYVGEGSTGSALMIGYYLPDGALHWSGTTAVTSQAVLGDEESIGLTASLAPEYESAPTIDEQYAMVIDTGLTVEDEQSFIDSVLSGAATGMLTPAYTIEQAPAGDLVVPDEDTTQASILSWVKTIAQSVVSLPQSIAKAVEAVFAPDAALVDEISATFTDKFGFVSTLHQLGTDLLSIDASSAPPVVYIHLEDAEGTINYGGTCKALDMSWYARYKEDGDRIMSGFLWIGFLWLLFKRASAIIQGAEMATDYGVDVHDGFRFRGERNGKRF